MKSLEEARQEYLHSHASASDAFGEGWRACARSISENLALIPFLRDVELVTALTGSPEHGNVTLSLPEWIIHVYEQKSNPE